MSLVENQRRETIDQAARVAAEVEKLILETYDIGDRLDSEAEMAKHYGVSRLTIREALKLLAGKGLVEIGRGRRPTVQAPRSSVLSGYLSMASARDPGAFLELTDIRLALEVLAAELACQHATRASVAAVRAAYNAMSEAADISDDEDHGAYIAADMAFHDAVGLASGSKMLAFILDGLRDALQESIERSHRGHVTREGSVVAGLARHREILEAIEDRDRTRAVSAVRKMLSETKRDLKTHMRDDFGASETKATTQ